MVGSWGYYMQGGQDIQDIEEMGKELSKILQCPVHYPAWGKRLFECKCNVIFPAFMVKYAVESGDWTKIMEQHEKGWRPIDE